MNRSIHALLLCLSLSLTAVAANADSPLPTPGETVPPPVFQTRDLAKPVSNAEAKGFVDFFNATFLPASGQPKLPLLGKQDVVWFPPQTFGDTSLESVHRAPADEAKLCNDPNGYPILCANNFSTGDFCQACHDSALFTSTGGLPEMAYYSHDKKLLANWSQYGDWSASIMRLATRDPIWQAQIETETNFNSHVDPTVIQDVCFSCHGEMGEHQLKLDLAATTTKNNIHFCTDIFYAMVPGIVPTSGRGKPFPYSDDCHPIQGMTVPEAPELYAKYGSLARDGVSCETCHRMGPVPGDKSWAGPGNWNGKDFAPFYGKKYLYNVHRKQTENPQPLEYDFTANFESYLDAIMTPDPKATLVTQPMDKNDYLDVAQAVNSKDKVSYLRQAVLCGGCHVLIVPQIPSAYKPLDPVPATGSMKVGDGKYPFYARPESCTDASPTFAAAPTPRGGNPLQDDCVASGYEQATYLEWINSAFATEGDTATTCQGCHMPLVTDPNNPSVHSAYMSQRVAGTDGITPKRYRRHRMMGINLPVFEMFAQFPDVLGIALYDDQVPDSGTSKDGTVTPFVQHNLLNGQMAIVEQATSQANGNGLMPNSTTPDPQAAVHISITSLTMGKDALTAQLLITNNTGHKFPSGAGFRRAFIKFEVLDRRGSVVWVSGQTNPYGAICDGLCVKTGNTYNLLPSEVNGGDPAKLQPHRAVIAAQDQVQIYEVQAVDDTGKLTSRTLSLFFDAKDNRLLPRGFASAKQLGCKDNPAAGQEIFGIAQCSAAYATKPQLKPLTVGSAIAVDPHYTNQSQAGSDAITYQIPIGDIKNAASVRVTMEYQTIPPGFLASRFSDGFDRTTNTFLPATERSIYLSSHLNTNLPLKSQHPDNSGLQLSKNWTMSLYQVSKNIR